MRSHAKAIVAVSAMLLTLALPSAASADAPPLATVDPATPSYTSAQLSGTVNPNGGPSTTFWQLQYSPTGEEGSWAVAGSGEFSGTQAEETTPLPVSAEVSGLKQNSAYFQRLVAFNEEGANQAIKAGPSFTTLEVSAASVSLDPVSTFTATTATFTGDINPNAPEAEPTTPQVEEAFETAWHFQCTPECPGLEGSLAADNSSHEVQAEASGLLPGTEYEVTLIAENAGPESSDGPETFTTEAAAPAVLSTSVSGLGTDSATLNAQLNPNGAQTTYRFEYVSAQQFEESEFAGATSTPESDPIGSETTSHAVSEEIAGLEAGTAYRYRVVATNSVDETTGPTKAFKTFELPSSGEGGEFPGQGFLPDDRAWEMVSPPDKNGGNVAASTQRSRAAVDGEAIQFMSTSGFADVSGSGISFDYIARRTEAPGANGWTTHAITPLQLGASAGELASSTADADPRYVGEFAPDLSRGVFKSYSPVPTPSDPHPMVEKTTNFYLAEDLTTPGAASFELISDCPLCVTPLTYNSSNTARIHFAGANQGGATHEPLTNVLYEAPRELTSDATAGTNLRRVFEGLAEPTDEYQTVSVNATAGQFKLEFNTQSSGDLAFDASAATVESALNALPSISPGSVSVKGGPGNAGATSPYVIGFTNGVGIEGTNVPQIAATSGTTPLSGGGASATTATRLLGGQHVRLAGRIPVAPATACDDSAAPACVGSPLASIAGASSGSSGSYAFNVVSDDGSQLIFRASNSVYLREDGLRTVKLNASEATLPGSPLAAEYWTASTDGSRIFFSTGEKLIDADTNGLTDLYMYDASKPASAPDNLTVISKGSGGSGGVTRVIDASEDGSHVYFISSFQLVSGGAESPATSKLHLWHEGELTYIGALGSSQDADRNSPRAGINGIGSSNTARVSSDGRYLLFVSKSSSGLSGQGGFAGYDHGGACTYDNATGFPCRELFVYSADADTLRCVSCHPSGASTTPLGDALLDEKLLTGGTQTYDQHLSQALSGDGRYAFFHTGEPLVQQDTNGQVDVYVYDTQTEERHLISSGESSKPSYFIDASDDGRDAFFATAERLSGWDVDTSYDIYDARIEGGLPEPPLPPPSCQGDACQPPPVALNDPTPSSSSFAGRGNEQGARKPARARCPKGKRRVKARSGKARCVKRKQSKRGTDNDRRAGR